MGIGQATEVRINGPLTSTVRNSPAKGGKPLTKKAPSMKFPPPTKPRAGGSHWCESVQPESRAHVHHRPPRRRELSQKSRSHETRSSQVFLLANASSRDPADTMRRDSYSQRAAKSRGAAHPSEVRPESLTRKPQRQRQTNKVDSKRRGALQSDKPHALTAFENSESTSAESICCPCFFF